MSSRVWVIERLDGYALGVHFYEDTAGHVISQIAQHGIVARSVPYVRESEAKSIRLEAIEEERAACAEIVRDPAREVLTRAQLAGAILGRGKCSD